jgi:hypothetical protein
MRPGGAAGMSVAALLRIVACASALLIALPAAAASATRRR